MLHYTILNIFYNIYFNKCLLFSSQKETQEQDGSKVVLFSNGTRKVLSADGQTSTVYFFNGDIKRTQSDGTIVSTMKGIIYALLVLLL